MDLSYAEMVFLQRMVILRANTSLLRLALGLGFSYRA